MDLAELMTPVTVKVPLEGFDKEEAIAELVEVLVRAGRVPDRQAVLDGLYAREAKGSTGIGRGVAIPHAKHPDLSGVVVAVGVSREGIEFDAADGELVYLVFLVLAETDNPGPNVEVLADIGNLMQVPGVYEEMISASSAEDLIQAVEKVQVEQ